MLLKVSLVNDYARNTTKFSASLVGRGASEASIIYINLWLDCHLIIHS